MEAADVNTPLRAQLNLANGITSLSIVSAVMSMFFAFQGRMPEALWIGAITLPCDVLDGVAARRRKSAGPFGAQLDSLSDAIGFGVLPAILAYALGVRGIGVAALLVYTLGATWRLAHFHEIGLRVDSKGRACFTGIPTTFAAAVFYLVAVAAVWIPGAAGRVMLLLFFGAMAFLMNAGFAFPKRGWHTRPLWVLVPLALASLAFWQ